MWWYKTYAAMISGEVRCPVGRVGESAGHKLRTVARPSKSVVMGIDEGQARKSLSVRIRPSASLQNGECRRSWKGESDGKLSRGNLCDTRG